jgi:hypothetical protein
VAVASAVAGGAAFHADYLRRLSRTATGGRGLSK